MIELKQEENSTDLLVYFKYVLDFNLLGTSLPSQAFAKGMIGRQNCSIIIIDSVASFKPLTKVSTYSSAKGAIVNFTQ